MRLIRAAKHFPSPLTSPEAQSAWTPPPGQALVSDAASQGWARCGHSHGRQAQRGHPTLTHSEAPVAPWSSGDWHLRAVAVTADTMSPPCSDEPDLTLEEKVLDPASPGSGLVALTCVLPPSCPSLANPAHPPLRLSSPLLQEGLLAPSLQGGASGRCHLDPGWAGGGCVCGIQPRAQAALSILCSMQGGTGLGSRLHPRDGHGSSSALSPTPSARHHPVQGLAQEELATPTSRTPWLFSP